jgi:predicted RecB family nuclease
MKEISGVVVFSPTDLSSFLACRRKTALDHAKMRGELQLPARDESFLEILRDRGIEHEKHFIDGERANGHEVVDLSPKDAAGKERQGFETRDLQIAATLGAMHRGLPRIVQAALASKDGRWFGYADVLRRIEVPSPNLGPWSYEAIDCKLSAETKGATILQLSVYSEAIEAIQGRAPEFFYVVTPAEEERYRVNDYAAYFRLMRDGLLKNAETLGLDTAWPYPEPTAHCDICHWQPDCERKRRADDHLSFVANCSKLQRDELAARGITTLKVLGREKLPPDFKPSRGARATYDRIQDQARLQLDARTTGTPKCEVLPIVADLGLCALPEPSAGDLFLDLEGATWACDGGREYLFGLVSIDHAGASVYEHYKALDDAQEKLAFEAVLDRLIATFDAHPGMHIYHFAPYETSAMKKLMGRHATRGPKLDRLLRAERFVDLYAVIRQAIRAGIESYSIKQLEQFYGFTRTVALKDAARCRGIVEGALDRRSPQLIKDADFDVVREYNKDDCVSTRELRDWLEKLRDEAIARGQDVRRTTKEVKVKEPSEVEAQARDLRARLDAELGVSEPENAEAIRLLGYTGDWHTREMKATWWEYYRLRDLPPEDQADEPMAIVGLEFVERTEVKVHKKTGKPTGTVTDRYRYASDQEMEIDEGDSLTLKDETDWGTVVAVDRIVKTIDVEKGSAVADLHPSAAFSFFGVGTEIIQQSVLAFAADVLAHGLGSEAAPFDCRRELLLRRPPRLNGEVFAPRDGEEAGNFAERISVSLDRTVLAIQGPPGTGKSYTGARMICALVAAGKKVGVTANSHKVVRNLLKGVRKEAAKLGQVVRIGHRGGEEADEAGIEKISGSTDKALAMLHGGVLDVLGAVAWTWSSDKAAAAVDVLFVDEAGQMSLANVLGSARAGASLVLLGDQQQLSQPSKAAHPDGIGVSALEHMLAGQRTMPAGHGIFLPRTRRLAPAIAKFTSDAFYEGRLDSLPELANQRLAHVPPLDSGALWLLPVTHARNQGYSLQEVDAVAALVERLLGAPSCWVDRNRQEHRIEMKDVAIVSPYNAQVSRLSARLPNHRVGTVDKFQGQEAPVVIYSMASSTPADAPRGMDFLYNLNRLNVATSRAQCAVIVVASPELFEPECHTPRQMALANGMATYEEMAKMLPGL